MPLRGFLKLQYLAPLVAVLLYASFTHAQDAATLARELVTVKGGYVEKKRHFEEIRIRAYVPILLKAVGTGPAWKPGHPNWADTEQRIAEEWRKYYLEYLAHMGRDTSYSWVDGVLARDPSPCYYVYRVTAVQHRRTRRAAQFLSFISRRRAAGAGEGISRFLSERDAAFARACNVRQ